jgi:hypothetical protein
MDPVIALYTVLLAVALGLSGFVRGDARRRGRGLLLAAALAGFMLVAATSALVNVTSITGMILTALAVLFAAQSATTAFSLLWREICCEPLARKNLIPPEPEPESAHPHTVAPAASPNSTEHEPRP